VVSPIRRVEGTILLPGSKSLSNRALLLAALSSGTTVLENLLDSQDVQAMRGALRSLGVKLQDLDATTLQVTGRVGALTGLAATNAPAPDYHDSPGSLWSDGAAALPGYHDSQRDSQPSPSAQGHHTLLLGNAGTAMRPLAAVLALVPGHWELTGDQRMQERPIGDLVEALLALGADIDYLKNPGYPPLLLRGKSLEGGRVAVRGDTSSQFLTALLMAAPLFQKGLEIVVEGELVSKPYIALTLDTMRRFGVSVEQDGFRSFRVPGTLQQAVYRSPGRFFIEGDASGASYFLAAGAIAGGRVRVTGAGTESVQGDVAFADALEQMGATIRRGPEWLEVEGGAPLHGIDFDGNAIPDAAMTLAPLALFATGTTTIRNVANWRVKETDRLAALATELRRAGATVEEGSDFLRIQGMVPAGSGTGSATGAAGSRGPWTAASPLPGLQPAEYATYEDHRMAMCLSLTALGGVPATILDPGCVAKTFPDFFDKLESLAQR